MRFLTTSDHIINLDQIAYVERQADSPLVVTIYFSVVTCTPGGELQPLSLILRGGDAEKLINELGCTSPK